MARRLSAAQRLDNLEGELLDALDEVATTVRAIEARRLVPRVVHLGDGTPALPIVGGRLPVINHMGTTAERADDGRLLFMLTGMLEDGTAVESPWLWFPSRAAHAVELLRLLEEQLDDN